MSESSEPSSFVIIEDAPDQARVVAAFINSEFPGSTILTAESVEKAIEILDKVTPTAVVLDVRLTDGSADEILKRYPASGRTYPILVTTGDRTEDLLGQMMALGADDFVLKPIDELIFQSKIRSMVGGRYISPLSFLGSREGLGTLRFDCEIEITSFAESGIRFQSAMAFVPGSELVVRLEHDSITAKCTSTRLIEGSSTIYVSDCVIGAESDSALLSLRKLIVKMTRANMPSLSSSALIGREGAT